MPRLHDELAERPERRHGAEDAGHDEDGPPHLEFAQTERGAEGRLAPGGELVADGGRDVLGAVSWADVIEGPRPQALRINVARRGRIVTAVRDQRPQLGEYSSAAKPDRTAPEAISPGICAWRIIVAGSTVVRTRSSVATEPLTVSTSSPTA
jgi:hypothetical protein